MTAPKGTYVTRGSSVETRLSFHTKKTPSCWLWTGHTNAWGYGVVRVDHKTRLAHRVSFEARVGIIPEGLKVLHKCDNPACVRPSHLFLGTDLDNTRDMIAKGRDYKSHGEDHRSAKLTDDLVREVRRAKPYYGYVKALASRLGVSVGAIQAVRQRRTWKHIT